MPTYMEFYEACAANALASSGEVPDDVHSFAHKHGIPPPGADATATVPVVAMERVYMHSVDLRMAIYLRDYIAANGSDGYGLPAELRGHGNAYVIYAPNGAPLLTDADVHGAEWSQLFEDGSASLNLGAFYRCFLSQTHIYDVFFDIWGPVFAPNDITTLRNGIETYSVNVDDNAMSILFDPTHRYWTERGRTRPKVEEEGDGDWAGGSASTVKQVQGGDAHITMFFTIISLMDTNSISGSEAHAMLVALSELHPENKLIKLADALIQSM